MSGNYLIWPFERHVLDLWCDVSIIAYWIVIKLTSIQMSLFLISCKEKEVKKEIIPVKLLLMLYANYVTVVDE